MGDGDNSGINGVADTAVVTFASVPDGMTLPIRVVRVLSSGTAASSIMGLY